MMVNVVKSADCKSVASAIGVRFPAFALNHSNPNRMTENEKQNLKISLQLKDEEITRQIVKRKLAEQTRNWTIILVVVIHILIWVL